MLLKLLLVEVLVVFSYSRADLCVICIESERDALFRLKQGLAEKSNRLSSWVGEDCCAWKGVACSKENGHVIKLDLQKQLVSSATQSSFRGFSILIYMGILFEGSIRNEIGNLNQTCPTMSWRETCLKP